MDTIFRHFLEHDGTPDKRRSSYAYWFINTFPKQEFVGEEQIFYDFMEYCVTLNSTLKEKYLEVFLSTELRPILIRDKIHVTGTESLIYDDPTALESAVRVTSTVMRDNFNALLTLEEDIDDFPVDMRAYMTAKKAERLTSILSSTFDIIQTSDDSLKASDYAESQIALINQIYDVESLNDIVETAEEDNEHMKCIAEFGLPAIDNDSGGIWTSQLIGIEAQPGTGKTRFALNVLYNAAVYRKTNCLFITLEQKKSEIEAMLVAKHVYNKFNKVVTDTQIRRNMIPQEISAEVAAAKIDLFDSGNYGKIVIEEKDLYVETFIQELKNLDKLKGPFQLIAIDYMGLLESKGEAFQKQKQLYDIIKSGFRQYKRYVRKTNKAGIAISQFNKEGVEAGQNDKQITTSMAEGGQAVYRNTDYNLSMSMTETMKLGNKRRFSQPKVRGSAGFGSVLVKVSLGICYFEQEEQKEV